MITGFYVRDEEGDVWWEKRRWFKAYYWVFHDSEHRNQKGMCLTITYKPFTHQSQEE
jgi:hypothetical protein